MPDSQLNNDPLGQQDDFRKTIASLVESHFENNTIAAYQQTDGSMLIYLQHKGQKYEVSFSYDQSGQPGKKCTLLNCTVVES